MTLNLAILAIVLLVGVAIGRMTCTLEDLLPKSVAFTTNTCEESAKNEGEDFHDVTVGPDCAQWRYWVHERNGNTEGLIEWAFERALPQETISWLILQMRRQLPTASFQWIPELLVRYERMDVAQWAIERKIIDLEEWHGGSEHFHAIATQFGVVSFLKWLRFDLKISCNGAGASMVRSPLGECGADGFRRFNLSSPADDVSQWNIAHSAVIRERMNVIEFLLDPASGLTHLLRETDESGRNIFHLAARWSSAAFFEQLHNLTRNHEAVASISDLDQFNKSIWHRAAESKDAVDKFELFDRLFGVDLVTHRNVLGQSPFLLCASSRTSAPLQWLLDNTAVDIHERSFAGQNLYNLAHEQENAVIAEWALRQGIKPTTPS